MEKSQVFNYAFNYAKGKLQTAHFEHSESVPFSYNIEPHSWCGLWIKLQDYVCITEKKLCIIFQHLVSNIK